MASTHFICIDSRHRDVRIHPSRHEFSIVLDPMIRGVRSIAPKSLIVPFSDALASPITGMTRGGAPVPTSWSTAASGSAAAIMADAGTFSGYGEEITLPYVVLHVREADPLSNYGTRPATAMFVCNKTIRTRNGRGYTLLEPVMDEEVSSGLPTTLSRVHVSILGPNGESIDIRAKDDIHVSTVSLIRRGMYAQIMTNEHFDSRDFVAGDLVRFDNAAISAKESDPSSWSSGDIASKQALARFVGREEGHVIRELGPPNAAGTFRTFIISTDIGYDRVAGTVIEGNYKALWQRVATLVTDDKGGEILGEAPTDAAEAPVEFSANVMNLSLQTAFFMTVESERSSM